MKTRTSFVLFLSLLLTGFISAAVLGADGEEAISKVKLTQEELPSSIKIEREVFASKQQLATIRPKLGFPLTALLNQVIVYESHQAMVNYMAFPGENWVDFGYSKLIDNDGRKSLVFEKDGVLIQMAATTKELEDWLVLLLRIDRLQTITIKFYRSPEDWTPINERFLSAEELRELEQSSGAHLRRGIAQDMVIRHRSVRINYYDCITEQSAGLVGQYLVERKKTIGKRLVRGNGPIVVVVDSPTSEFNEYMMGFVNW